MRKYLVKTLILSIASGIIGCGGDLEGGVPSRPLSSAPVSGNPAPSGAITAKPSGAVTTAAPTTPGTTATTPPTPTATAPATTPTSSAATSVTKPPVTAASSSAVTPKPPASSSAAASVKPPVTAPSSSAKPTTSAAPTAAPSSSAAPVALDCNAPVPSGGTVHTSNNLSGTDAGLSWTIWSNSKGGTITTYGKPAFSASWSDTNDFLARLGVQWKADKTYDQLGTITAQFAEKKTGKGGLYSYVGIYGWSVTPCVEWYIIDDSFNTMPVNPGNTTNKGTADIDGGSYIFYTRNTNGTGGSKCGSSVTSWIQFYSVRKTARQCGEISISKHFDAWNKAGMTLGKMDQAQLLIETGGDTGSIDFTTANITTTP